MSSFKYLLMSSAVLFTLSFSVWARGAADSPSESPKLEVLEGYIQKHTEKAGTLSQYEYYLLVNSPGARSGGIVIFQRESGKSIGFSSSSGQLVRLTGEWGIGIIDWQGTERRGFLVDTVVLIE